MKKSRWRRPESRYFHSNDEIGQCASDFTGFASGLSAFKEMRLPWGVVLGRGTVATGEMSIAIGGDIHEEIFAHGLSPHVLSQDQAFERFGAAVRSNLSQLERNIEKARIESGQFFKLTLIFAAPGFLIILASVGLLLASQVAAGVVSTISALIPEVTAVLFFRKDKELRTTIERYHQYVNMFWILSVF